MPTLNLKPTHKPVKAYYESLDQFDRLGVTHETAVPISISNRCSNPVGSSLIGRSFPNIQWLSIETSGLSLMGR